MELIDLFVEFVRLIAPDISEMEIRSFWIESENDARILRENIAS